MNINKGKVNIYTIFLTGEVRIFFHSVMVVIPPNTSRVRYIFSSICPTDSKATNRLSPARAPTTPSVRLTRILTVERTKAGMMAMDISKQEKLPRKMPRRRRAP